MIETMIMILVWNTEFDLGLLDLILMNPICHNQLFGCGNTQLVLGIEDILRRTLLRIHFISFCRWGTFRSIGYVMRNICVNNIEHFADIIQLLLGVLLRIHVMFISVINRVWMLYTIYDGYH